MPSASISGKPNLAAAMHRNQGVHAADLDADQSVRLAAEPLCKPLYGKVDIVSASGLFTEDRWRTQHRHGKDQSIVIDAVGIDDFGHAELLDCAQGEQAADIRISTASGSQKGRPRSDIVQVVS